MKRRDFITLLGGAAVVWPHAAPAQSASNRPLIAYLAGGRQVAGSGLVSAFREGLQELGYYEGHNIDIVYRFAEGRVEQYPVLAEELVRLKPAVVLAGAVDTAIAVKNVTSTIAIVSPALTDAVHLGLVASFARPGGNVTGIAPYVDGLPAKQMELARELIPGAGKIGVLGNIFHPRAQPQRYELEDTAQKLGVEVVAPEVHGPEDLDGAMTALASAGVDVVIVVQSPMLFTQRRQVVALAAANRLPTMCGYREHVDDGGLISYGVNLRWCFHRIATFVHKILNGTAPGDLPVEFPTKLEMVINLRTATALGLAVPQSILARADEVIE
jgi:putative ABC transport system substrate-binding protein